MTYAIRSGAILACLGLSACGGSSSEPPSYQDRGQLYNDLVLSIQGVSPTPTSAIPDTGSATYTGVGRINAGGSEGTLLGALELTTDFENGDRVTGSIDDLVNSSGERWSGSIDMTGGTINRSGSGDQFTGNLSGTLTDAAGTDRTVGSGSTFRGSFAGSGYEHVAGALTMSLCASGAGSCTNATGTYIGER